jgi:diguanylate cyclase (GGDEF)-like protein
MEFQKRIDEALYQQLIANSAIPLIGSALACVFVVIAQVNSKNIDLVLNWAGLIFASIAIRIWLTQSSKKQLASSGYNSKAAFRYAVSTGISGIAWGLGGLLITDATPVALIITTTAIQTMIMGGVLTLGVFIPAFLSFAIPAALPMIIVFALSGGVANILLALYSSIFLALMFSIAFRFNKSLRNTWQITFEKEDLVKSLTEAHSNVLTAKLAADQAIKELELISTTDQLTGLFNRRKLDQVLFSEQNRIDRYGQTLSIVIADLDNFKTVNDLHGHLVGDKVLFVIANLFSQGVRESDALGRWGGEEFMIICPSTDLNGAVAIAEKLRKMVRANELDVVGQVSCSFGVAEWSNKESIDSLILRADAALYRAKEYGRNRVESDSLVQ